MYSAVTDGIAVTAEPFYLEDQSDPSDGRYVWGYRITIANNSAAPVQLLSRHWRIVDANGRVEEVRGPGVVGEQPVIDPGERYEYASRCPLSTASGMMSGSYTMTGEDGQHFPVAIPAFSLDSPGLRRSLN